MNVKNISAAILAALIMMIGFSSASAQEGTTQGTTGVTKEFQYDDVSQDGVGQDFDDLKKAAEAAKAEAARANQEKDKAQAELKLLADQLAAAQKYKVHLEGELQAAQRRLQSAPQHQRPALQERVRVIVQTQRDTSNNIKNGERRLRKLEISVYYLIKKSRETMTIAQRADRSTQAMEAAAKKLGAKDSADWVMKTGNALVSKGIVDYSAKLTSTTSEEGSNPIPDSLNQQELELTNPQLQGKETFSKEDVETAANEASERKAREFRDLFQKSEDEKHKLQRENERLKQGQQPEDTGKSEVKASSTIPYMSILLWTSLLAFVVFVAYVLVGFLKGGKGLGSALISSLKPALVTLATSTILAFVCYGIYYRFF